MLSRDESNALEKQPLISKKTRAPILTALKSMQLWGSTHANSISQGASLESLPTELLLKVAGYLTIKELGRFSQINSSFQKLAEDNTLWKSRADSDLVPLQLTTQAIIAQSDADTIPGLRKQFYRNTLIMNNIVKIPDYKLEKPERYCLYDGQVACECMLKICPSVSVITMGVDAAAAFAPCLSPTLSSALFVGCLGAGVLVTCLPVIIPAVDECRYTLETYHYQTKKEEYQQLNSIYGAIYNKNQINTFFYPKALDTDYSNKVKDGLKKALAL